MAANFEKIVRPYETGQPAIPFREIPAGMTWSNAPIRLRPGMHGSAKSFQASYSWSVSYYVVKKPREKTA